MPRTYGYQPTGDEQPGTPPAGPAGASTANATTYEDLRIDVTLGRGIRVRTAPEHTKIAIGLLGDARFGIGLDHPGHIKINYQVEYEITGYDPADCALTLHLVNDWRPGRKDAPRRPPTRSRSRSS